MFNMQSSAIPIPKCNIVRRENEVVGSGFKSNWNENSKKRCQKISPKKSKKVGLHNELLPIHKLEINNGKQYPYINQQYDISNKLYISMLSP